MLFSDKCSGLGGATLEAMACNCVVVSNGLIHIANKMVHKNLGIIPNSQDYTLALRNAINNLDQFDKSRNSVSNNYSWEKVIEELVEQYKPL